MSILTELKKLTKKKNATVVSQALPDSLDGDGSGSSGDGDPVIVDITKISSQLGTWSGATWEELVEAWYRGMAFIRVAGSIAPGTTGDMIMRLDLYASIYEPSESHALYAMLGNEPIIIDNEGGASGNLP